MASDSAPQPLRVRRTWTWVGVALGVAVTVAAVGYAFIGLVMLPFELWDGNADVGDYFRIYAPAVIAGAVTLFLAVRAEWNLSHNLARVVAAILTVLSACALGVAILYASFVVSLDGLIDSSLALVTLTPGLVGLGIAYLIRRFHPYRSLC